MALEDRSGSVYLVEAKSVGTYRIGRSKDIGTRGYTHNAYSPVPVRVIHHFWCEDSVTAETNLQRIFKHKNYKSSWYNLNQSEVNWIKSLKSEEDIDKKPATFKFSNLPTKKAFSTGRNNFVYFSFRDHADEYDFKDKKYGGKCYLAKIYVEGKRYETELSIVSHFSSGVEFYTYGIERRLKKLAKSNIPGKIVVEIIYEALCEDERR